MRLLLPCHLILISLKTMLQATEKGLPLYFLYFILMTLMAEKLVLLRYVRGNGRRAFKAISTSSGYLAFILTQKESRNIVVSKNNLPSKGRHSIF